MVSVVSFGVRVSVMFHHLIFRYILVRFWLVSGHLLGNSCPLGCSYVLIVLCLFVIFIFFPFWFLELELARNAPFPVHCLSIALTHFLHQGNTVFCLSNTFLTFAKTRRQHVEANLHNYTTTVNSTL